MDEEREPMDCLFCKIISGQIPSRKVYQDEQCLAFADINPQAPVHFLIVPRKHVPSLSEATHEHEGLIGHLHVVAAELARENGLHNGYRTVINTGPDGGQTVAHLHVHLLGGREFHWPPG